MSCDLSDEGGGRFNMNTAPITSEVLDQLSDAIAAVHSDLAAHQFDGASRKQFLIRLLSNTHDRDDPRIARFLHPVSRACRPPAPEAILQERISGVQFVRGNTREVVHVAGAGHPSGSVRPST